MKLDLSIKAEGQEFIVPLPVGYTEAVEERINNALGNFLDTLPNKIDIILTDLALRSIGIKKDWNRIEIDDKGLIAELLRKKAVEFVGGLDLQAEIIITDEIRAAIATRFKYLVNDYIRHDIARAAHDKVDAIIAHLLDSKIKFTPIPAEPTIDEACDPRFGADRIDELRLAEYIKVTLDKQPCEEKP